MADKLSLEVLLALVDKFEAPARKVGLTSKAMAKAVKAARVETKALNAQLGQVRDLKRMQAALGATGQELDAANRKLADLHKEANAAGGANAALTKRIAATRKEVARLTDRQQALKRHASAARGALREQGVDTRRLGDAEKTLSGRIEQVNGRLKTQKAWLGRLGAAGTAAGRALKGVLGVAKLGAGLAVAGGAALVPFVRTAAEFERFRTILETVEGSSAKAQKAMDWVSNFAIQTPYELDQVTEAYVRLRAYGMDPTNGLLKTLGDTSAAMGKDVMQAVEAIADAVTGENERLKEFGIKASTKGNQIIYTYTDRQGVQRQLTVMKNDRKAIEKALMGIWNAKYAGAMERQSHTWTGLLSNIADQWTRFQNMVMASGPFEQMKGQLQGVLDLLNKMAADGTLQQQAEQLGQVISTFIRGGVVLARALVPVGRAFYGLGTWIGETLAAIVLSVQKLLAFLSALPDRMLELGRNIIDGLGRGIDEKIAWIKEKVAGLGKLLPGWLKEKLGIQSPSRVFAEIGDNSMAGLAEGLARSQRGPLAAIAGAGKRMARTAAGVSLVAAGSAAALPAGAATAGAQQPVVINVTIYAAPGQDPRAIGRGAVDAALARFGGSASGALFDED